MAHGMYMSDVNNIFISLLHFFTPGFKMTHITDPYFFSEFGAGERSISSNSHTTMQHTHQEM